MTAGDRGQCGSLRRRTVSATAALPAPPAAAVTPPVVDNSLLPKPGSPAPPRRTEQTTAVRHFSPRATTRPRRRTVEGTLICHRLGHSAGVRADRRRHRHRGVAAPASPPSRARRRLRVDRRRHRRLRRARHDRGRNHRRDAEIHRRSAPSAVSPPMPPSSAFASPAISFGAPTTVRIWLRRCRHACHGRAHRRRHGRDGDQRVVRRVPAVEDGLDDRALGAALSYAVDVKNVVVVAAAGNVGGPGQCPEQNPAPDPARPGSRTGTT